MKEEKSKEKVAGGSEPFLYTFYHPPFLSDDKMNKDTGDCCLTSPNRSKKSTQKDRWKKSNPDLFISFIVALWLIAALKSRNSCYFLLCFHQNGKYSEPVCQLVSLSKAVSSISNHLSDGTQLKQFPVMKLRGSSIHGRLHNIMRAALLKQNCHHKNEFSTRPSIILPVFCMYLQYIKDYNGQ